MANIFLKICPECARPSVVTAAACVCGYIFPSHEGQPDAPQLDIAREEALYEEYLRARAEQAFEAAKVAKRLAELFPNDRQRALEAAKLESAAQVAQAALVSQRERVAGVREALKQGINPATSAAA